MRERAGGWIRRGLEEPAREGLGAPDPERETPVISTIEHGCEVAGELRLDGPLTVHGDFRGSIDCRGVVTIGARGSVQGPIRGRRVLVYGSVVGDVTATRDVVLDANSRLHGDVTTPSLVVERGAFFNGRTEMVRPLPSSYARSQAAAAPGPDA